MSEWLLKPNLQDLNVMQPSPWGCQDLMVAYGRVHPCIVLVQVYYYGNLTIERRRKDFLDCYQGQKKYWPIGHLHDRVLSVFAFVLFKFDNSNEV